MTCMRFVNKNLPADPALCLKRIDRLFPSKKQDHSASRFQLQSSMPYHKIFLLPPFHLSGNDILPATIKFCVYYSAEPVFQIFLIAQCLFSLVLKLAASLLCL